MVKADPSQRPDGGRRPSSLADSAQPVVSDGVATTSRSPVEPAIEPQGGRLGSATAMSSAAMTSPVMSSPAIPAPTIPTRALPKPSRGMPLRTIDSVDGRRDRGAAEVLEGRLLFDDAQIRRVLGDTLLEVSNPEMAQYWSGVRCDDRLSQGDLWVAIRGEHHDGHDVLRRLAQPGREGVVPATVPATGIKVAVGELPVAELAQLPLPYYRVASSRRALGLLSQAAHGFPATYIRNFGITGTNGKSTVVNLLASILEISGRSVGWSGTVTTRWGRVSRESAMTTPDGITLARGMAELVAHGGSDAVLEVSSHALHQERLAGVELRGALLTNVGWDHLDYHGDRDSYREAKLAIFGLLEPGMPAVIPASEEIPLDHPQLRGTRVLTFAESVSEYPQAAAHVVSCEFRSSGLTALIHVLGEEWEVETSLVGRHNLRNVLAAALLAKACAVPREAIVRGLRVAPAVTGRLQRVPSPTGQVYVDYAHTPDALDAVLEAAREFTPGRLMVLFGCGGDRDSGKRPEMGRIAERRAHRVYITSDNPRSEPPGRIVNDILTGLDHPERAIVEVDRAVAIRRALADLTDDDVLIVAGKGHEREQCVGNERFPFDDAAVIRSAWGGA